MKRILFKLLSFALLTLALSWQTACRRMIDLEAPKIRGKGKVEVRDNVYVLDSVFRDQLIELTNDHLLFRENPTLRGGRLSTRLKIAELKTGDVVIGYPSSVAPNGFWAKVTVVNTESKNIRVNYKEPSFSDLFLNIDTTFSMNWPDVKGSGGFEFPVKKEINNTSIETVGTINGEVSYDLRTEFQMIMVDGVWKRIRIESFLGKKQKASIDIEGTVAYSNTKNIVCKDLVRFPVQLGSLPIFIWPVARLDLKGKLAASAKVSRETIEIDNTTSCGILYDGNSWSVLNTTNEKPVGRRLSAEIKGKAEVGIEGAIEGYFYQFIPVNCDNNEKVRFSIGLGLEGYLGIEGSCQQPEGLSVRSYIGLKEKLALTAKLFDIEASPSASVSVERDLFKWTAEPTNKLCSADTTNGLQPIPNEVEDSPTAVSTADPHLTTFDRGSYSFMGVGEFVAAKSTTDNFLVQVRQSPYPNNTQVAVNTGIAVRTGPDVVCIYAPNRLYVNRQPVPLSFTDYSLSNGGSLRYQNNRLTIKNANGDLIEVKLLTADLDYFITPAKNRKGKLIGIMGNYDGNPQNDIAKADGQVLRNDYSALYPTFADSWRIKDTESLFFYDAGKNTNSYTDKAFPYSEIQLTSAQSTAAEQICRQAGVTDPVALQGCIIDVALTGNRGFADRAKENEVVSGAKTTLSVSNFAQYRNEFVLGSGGAINANTALLPSKGTIRWSDAYLNRGGYETEIVLAVNAPSPCFPLFDLEVVDLQNAGVKNFLRLSTNNGRTQVELVNSGMQPEFHPVNVFDGNRHRIKVRTAKLPSGSNTTLVMDIFIDNYAALTIRNTYPAASLLGYLYPMLKNETLNCNNGQITIYGWSFKSK